MRKGTRYPHGVEADTHGTHTGDTHGTHTGGVIRSSVTVDLTNSVVLAGDADDIVISASGESKTLQLNLSAGRMITVTNNGDEDVTVKNTADDTGVTVADGTAAVMLTTGTSVKLIAGGV